MSWFTVEWGALFLIAIGGAAAFLARKNPKWATGIALTALSVGVITFAGANCREWSNVLFFRIPILVLALAGGFFSPAYLKGHGEERSGIYWFFFNLTVSAMLAVTLCTQKIPFLTAWEIMGLSSMGLVLFNYKETATVRASWSYLLACEAGGLLLMMLFLFNGNSIVTLILALLAFGLKIGFPLLHYWLPEAHPAAPAPVSALMSGAMIQLGFYGLYLYGYGDTRKDILIAGTILLILGCIGALCGIIFALSKSNLKGMLAYSSIENMGIIAMGSGLTLLSDYYDRPACSLLAGAGVCLHMLNHAFLKGGLFLGAGAIQKAMHGSLNVDEMGGLLKRMPFTGTIFLMTSAGLSGLPPFAGFVSEFLIYYSAILALTSHSGSLMIAATVVLIVLSLTGGFAAAGFTKIAGAIFLGEPRSQHAAEAVEVPRSMKIVLATLFLCSILMVILAPVLFTVLAKNAGIGTADELYLPLWYIAGTSLAVTILSFLLIFWRNRILKRGTRRSCTWDCGYARPDARMEYTGTAFSQPLTDFFQPLLRSKHEVTLPEGEFPAQASYREKTNDPAAKLYLGIVHLLGRIAEKVHAFQSGYLHLYILIATAALLLLLIWGLLTDWSGSILSAIPKDEIRIFPWNTKGGAL